MNLTGTMPNMKRTAALAMLGMLAALAGCATISESTEQSLMVRAIEDHREIGGVGCVLTNVAGRWFVTAPGHVTVHRSAGNLFVDCKKGTVSAGQETFVSRANNSATIGNAVTSAGLGYLLDKRTGAGFDYPETLVVQMKRTGKPAAAPVREDAPGAIY